MFTIALIVNSAHNATVPTIEVRFRLNPCVWVGTHKQWVVGEGQRQRREGGGEDGERMTAGKQGAQLFKQVAVELLSKGKEKTGQSHTNTHTHTEPTTEAHLKKHTL